VVPRDSFPPPFQFLLSFFPFRILIPPIQELLSRVAFGRPPHSPTALYRMQFGRPSSPSVTSHPPPPPPPTSRRPTPHSPFVHRPPPVILIAPCLTFPGASLLVPKQDPYALCGVALSVTSLLRSTKPSVFIDQRLSFPC